MNKTAYNVLMDKLTAHPAIANKFSRMWGQYCNTLRSIDCMAAKEEHKYLAQLVRRDYTSKVDGRDWPDEIKCYAKNALTAKCRAVQNK